MHTIRYFGRPSRSFLGPLAVWIAAAIVFAVDVRAEPEPYWIESPAWTGVNSRLTATQCAMIKDQASWQNLWQIHSGTLSPTDVPEVDFERFAVLVVVTKSSNAPNGWRIDDISNDDEQVTIRLAGMDPQTERRRRQENAFGFFQVPRFAFETVIQYQTQNGDSAAQWKTLATLPPTSTAPTQQQVASPQQPVASPSPARHPGGWNLTFGLDPYHGNYDGVVGSATDLWNFVGVGTTAIDFTRNTNTSTSPIRVRVSRHDGVWAIKEDRGIFGSYIYHNCQCVDLETTLLDVPAGDYRIHVFAHGDAPDQNAAIELVVGEESYGKKATGNDGSWDFRKRPYAAGIHYVTFDFHVTAGQEVKLISHRDGSGYSMFNAIQLVPGNHQKVAQVTGRQ